MMLARTIASSCLLLCLSVAAGAQTTPLDVYLANQDAREALEALGAAAGNSSKPALTPASARPLLPLANINSFIGFVLAKRPIIAVGEIESLRLNKVLQSAAASGGTSALSSAIGPALLGAAVEYGGVLQESAGTTTTLRGNLLGLARLAGGAEQFPYCPALDPQSCNRWSRSLRRVSGVVSFEQKSAAAQNIPAKAPTAADLLGSGYRVASIGAKLELSAAGHPDDPAFVRGWTEAIRKLQQERVAEPLGAAFADLFDGDNLELYSSWQAATLAALDAAKSSAEFRTVLDAQLNSLVDELLESDPGFPASVRALSRALSNYRTVRDELLMQAQVHKSSLEYTHRSPVDQPGLSNLRFIYSHQPTRAPLIYTVNVAATIYDSAPDDVEQWRDLQVAAQLDRRLGQVASLGSPVLTLALYYQWMRDNAVVKFADTAAATLSGLTVNDAAKAVLGTAGHIVVFQGRVSIPLNEVVKVPFSMTYSNRRELIPEKKTWRGQVGLSIDVDGLFK